MFDPDQFHDPEFRSLVRATRAVVAERVPPRCGPVDALDGALPCSWSSAR